MRPAGRLFHVGKDTPRGLRWSGTMTTMLARPSLAAALVLLATACAPGGDTTAEPAEEAGHVLEHQASTGTRSRVEGNQATGSATRELDAEAVRQGVERLRAMRGTRVLLVAQGDRVLVAERFRGGSIDSPHDVKSASKSILSALVGIAHAEGSISDLDHTVAALLPGRLPPAAAEVTVRHLLTMTPGLASTSGEHYGAWVSTRDWTSAALRRPRIAPPGETFVYSTGSSHVLSAILTETTGMATREYAAQRLLGPLGITVSSWDRSPEGYDFGGNNVVMTPREMLAFGRLYAAQGRHDGRQLVPRDWVAESTQRHAEGWPDRYGAYGYLWWLPPAGELHAFTAVGYGGQFIWVAPELEVVIVLTASHEGKGAAWDRRVLSTFAAMTAGVS
jgi:CubicO group peptidase (beta-lactamase class C family)